MALRRDEHVQSEGKTERIERVEHFHESGTAAAPATNVNVGPAATNDTVTALTRVVLVFFTVLEVLVLFRFFFKLSGANANQPLIAGLYAVTEVLVRPFQGIFPEPQAPGVVLDLAALLSALFLFLIGWLIVALVRAIVGRTV